MCRLIKKSTGAPIYRVSISSSSQIMSTSFSFCLSHKPNELKLTSFAFICVWNVGWLLQCRQTMCLAWWSYGRNSGQKIFKIFGSFALWHSQCAISESPKVKSIDFSDNSLILRMCFTFIVAGWHYCLKMTLYLPFSMKFVAISTHLWTKFQPTSCRILCHLVDFNARFVRSPFLFR